MKKNKWVAIPSILGLALAIFLTQFYLGKLDKKEDVKEKEQFGETKEIIIESTDIFKDYYGEAEKLLENMTIEEKVGQLFLVRYDKSQIEYFSSFYPGGYILFARDFENHNKQSIKSELERDQSLNKYKLILGVDEEGGTVTRVSRFSNFRTEGFASPKTYFNQGGYELLETTENEKLTLLKSIGINLNLAPVADISTNENDFIYDRSFGRGTDETSEFIRNMVKYANNNKINSCLKHFPGYGNNVDTHTGIAIDERDYKNFEENDYKPFIAGIKENVPSVLVSHNIVKSIDEEYPSSLSKKVITELREKLNFSGIIMTDDLAMDAVKSYVEDGKAATIAINAGCDMIITSDFIEMRNEVLESVKNNQISEETINKAVKRIIAWKYYSELYDN